MLEPPTWLFVRYNFIGLQPVRDSIKNFLAALLFHTGMLRLAVALLLRNKAVVLMYHRVLPDEVCADSFSAEAIVVRPATFAMHMTTLKRYLRPIGIAEFMERLAGQRSGFSRHCLVTFDDGWYDNQAYALPLLSRHNIPVLIFVATGYIGTAHTFWQERISRMLHRLWTQRSTDPVLADIGVPRLSEQSAESVKRYIRAAVTELKRKSSDEINLLVERVASALRTMGLACDDYGHDRFLSWDEVRDLSTTSVVTIGSHARSHTPLTQLSAQAIQQELMESRRIIREQVGKDTPWFAYPNGDHHDVSCQLVAETGYRFAATTTAGSVSVGDDPMRVRRINIHEKAAPSPARLLCKVVGLF